MIVIKFIQEHDILKMIVIAHCDYVLEDVLQLFLAKKHLDEKNLHGFSL